MRVLIWNLFHGRSVPGSGISLRDQFSSALAGWSWDVALLQEVPPWWPRALASAAGAQQCTALTARNSLLPLRRALAERWPDAIKSGGGGANTILARTPIVMHESHTLRRLPERRVLQLARIGNGVCVANLHCSAHSPRRARADLTAARRLALRFAAGAPLVLGGDLNLRDPEVAGLTHVSGRDVDHIFARGLSANVPAEALARGTLSDHPPLRIDLRADVE